MTGLAQPWTDEQNAIIRDNPHLLGREIKVLLKAIGSERSIKSVEVQRLKLSGKRSGSQRSGSQRPPGYNSATELYAWPILQRDPEWRDAEFVRRVIVAAKAEGLLRVSR